jgi:hypothetical protein
MKANGDTLYNLDDTVNAIDEYGNSYRRKIRVGFKRGEFEFKMGKDNVGLAMLVAKPEFINLTNLKTGEPVRHPIGKDEDGNTFNLCFPLTPESTKEAEKSFKHATEVK